MTDAATIPPIEDVMKGLRRKLSTLRLGSDPSSRVALGDRGADLLDPIINALALTLIKSPQLQKLSARPLEFALHIVPELIVNAVAAVDNNRTQEGGRLDPEDALRKIPKMLRMDHPFITHNLIPRALFQDEMQRSGDPNLAIAAIAGYVQQNQSTLFAGLGGAPQRAAAIATLAGAMEEVESVSTTATRNTLSDLPPGTKLMLMQRALTVASSGIIGADRIGTCLHPYGTTIARLVAQASNTAHNYVLPASHRFTPEGTPASQAITRFMNEIRSIPHYKQQRDPSGAFFPHKIGSDFSPACDRLAASLDLLLSHPDLASSDADALYHTLAPLRETFTHYIEQARQSAGGKDAQPFLTSIDDLITHLEQRFISPDSFYASLGVVLEAQFHHDMTKLNYAPPFRLQTGLDRIVHYCDENQHTLYRRADGTTQPAARHKLSLLSNLAAALSDHENSDASTYCAEARARILIAAIGQSLALTEPQIGWESALSLPDPILLQAANGMTDESPQNLATVAACNDRSWDPVLNPNAPKLLAPPPPEPEPTVVRFPNGNALTPGGRQKFDERMAHTDSTPPTTEGLSQAELDAAHGKPPKPGKGELVSFADRQAAAASDKSTQR